MTGDVIAWAQDIRIEGKVDGSCICGAQYLRINGQVDGNVRGFAQHVTIEGSVAKNLTSWAQTLEIPSRGKVGGGVLAFMAELSYSGRVERDFTAWFHEGDLNGYVGGNALLREGRLTIGPNAEIRGSAAYKGERKPEVSPQAKLANPLSVDIVHHRPDPTRPRFYWSQLLRTAAAFVFGMALLLLMPGFFSGVVKTGDRVVPALAFGTLALVATPVLAVVACVTLVGIPVGIAALFLYATMLYASEAFVGAWLGGKILGPGVGQAAQMGRLALGLVLLRVAFHLPLVKVVVVLYMFLAGLGAIVLTAYERLQVPASGASA